MTVEELTRALQSGQFDPKDEVWLVLDGQTGIAGALTQGQFGPTITASDDL